MTALDISTNGGGDGAIENTVVASSAQANTVTSTVAHSLKIQPATISSAENNNNKESSGSGTNGGAGSGGGGGGGSSSGDTSATPTPSSPTVNPEPAPAPQASTNQPSAATAKATTELLSIFPIHDQPIDSFEEIKTPNQISVFELRQPLKFSNQQLDTVIAGTNKRDKITGSSSGEIIAGGEGKDVISGGGGADGFLFQNPEGFGKKKPIKSKILMQEKGTRFLSTKRFLISARN